MLVRRAGRLFSVRVPRPPSQPGVLVMTCRPTPGSAVAEIAMSTGGELRYPRTAARINSDTARPLRAASRRSSPSSSAGNRVENTVIPLGVGTTTCSSFSISLSIALPFLLRARPPGTGRHRDGSPVAATTKVRKAPPRPRPMNRYAPARLPLFLTTVIRAVSIASQSSGSMLLRPRWDRLSSSHSNSEIRTTRLPVIDYARSRHSIHRSTHDGHRS